MTPTLTMSPPSRSAPRPAGARWPRWTGLPAATRACQSRPCLQYTNTYSRCRHRLLPVLPALSDVTLHDVWHLGIEFGISVAGCTPHSVETRPQSHQIASGYRASLGAQIGSVPTILPSTCQPSCPGSLSRQVAAVRGAKLGAQSHLISRIHPPALLPEPLVVTIAASEAFSGVAKRWPRPGSRWAAPIGTAVASPSPSGSLRVVLSKCLSQLSGAAARDSHEGQPSARPARRRPGSYGEHSCLKMLAVAKREHEQIKLG
jgi:hypothetical protein